MRDTYTTALYTTPRGARNSASTRGCSRARGGLQGSQAAKPRLGLLQATVRSAGLTIVLESRLDRGRSTELGRVLAPPGPAAFQL